MAVKDPSPCPNCGHCPTCGRANSQPYFVPYPYWYPTTNPQWYGRTWINYATTAAAAAAPIPFSITLNS